MSLAKVLVISAAAHLAVLGGIVVMQPPVKKNTESIGVMMHEKKKPKKEDEEKPKPIEAPPEVLHHKSFAAPKPAAEPPPPDPAPAQHAALNAAPDYGISMSGVGGPGGVGIGIPVGPGGGNSTGVKGLTAPPPKEKNFGTVKEAAQTAESPCAEEPVKAKPLGTFNPPYTDEARSAEVEGRVKLKLTVDAAGNVTAVQVMSGLGHGLDESAIATAKRMKFTPASACSKPVSSTFIVGASFRLGE